MNKKVSFQALICDVQPEEKGGCFRIMLTLQRTEGDKVRVVLIDLAKQAKRVKVTVEIEDYIRYKEEKTKTSFQALIGDVKSRKRRGCFEIELALWSAEGNNKTSAALIDLMKQGKRVRVIIAIDEE